MGRLGYFTLAFAILLAGCVGGGPVSDDTTSAKPDAPHWAEAALASAHDHTDPALHANLTTPNFRITGWTPLISETYGTTVQGNLCGDAVSTRDGRRLAAIESRGDIAFSVADVTDPANPQWLGELVMRTTYVYDLAVVPDGRHVVLVTSQHKTPDQPPAAGDAADLPPGEGLWWRSPCAPSGTAQWQPVRASAASEDLVPRPASMLLVSIEDPSSPRIVDQVPLGGFGHGVSSWDIDGRLWVAASTVTCTPAVLGCPATLSAYHFYEVAETPVGARLERLSTYTIPFEDDPRGLQVGHTDVWLATHPVTGTLLAYCAAWDDGLLLLDMSDPMAPKLVGRWTDHDPAQGPDDTGSIHSAHPFPDVRDGRHYTLIGPEIIGHPTTLPTGVVHVLDTTDPTVPFEVAAWTLPHDVVWEERLHFSTHYLTVHNNTAFVSMYHGGVWALDLSGLGKEPFTLLPGVGVFMPVSVSPQPPARPFRWAPTQEEVLSFPDGSLVTFDSNSGLYTFRFDEAAPASPPEPWPLAPAKAS